MNNQYCCSVIFIPGFQVQQVQQVQQVYKLIKKRTKCRHTDPSNHVVDRFGNIQCLLCSSVFNYCSSCSKAFTVATLVKREGVCGVCFRKKEENPQSDYMDESNDYDPYYDYMY